MAAGMRGAGRREGAKRGGEKVHQSVLGVGKGCLFYNIMYKTDCMICDILLENLFCKGYIQTKYISKNKCVGAIMHLQPISSEPPCGVSRSCDTDRGQCYNRVKSSSVLIRPQA